MFCSHNYIETESHKLFNQLKNDDYLVNTKSTAELTSKLTHYFTEINAIHPFREGNGRTNREFIRQLAEHNGMRLDFLNTNREDYLQASINSYRGDSSQLEALFNKSLSPIQEQVQDQDKFIITKKTTIEDVLSHFERQSPQLVEDVRQTKIINPSGHNLKIEYVTPKMLAEHLNNKSANKVKIEIAKDKEKDFGFGM